MIIRELHQQIGERSYQQHTQGLDSLNQRTGAKFAPTQPPPNIRKGAQAALPQGNGLVITPADTKPFLDATGGDKNKARQLALQNGWKLQ